MQELQYFYLSIIDKINRSLVHGFDTEEIQTLSAQAIHVATEINAMMLGLETVEDLESRTVTLFYDDGTSRQIMIFPEDAIHRTELANTEIDKIMSKK